MAVLRRAPPPRADRLGRSLLWMVHTEAEPLRVPPTFGQCRSGAGEPRRLREALGEPVPDRQPFAWFAWLQRARVTDRWLFGFVGRVGQRPGTRQRKTLGLLRLAPAPRRGRGLQGQVPSCPSLLVPRGPGSPTPPAPSPPPCPPPRRRCCLRRRLSSPGRRVCLLSFVSNCRILVFGCVSCLLCWGEGFEHPRFPPQLLSVLLPRPPQSLPAPSLLPETP